MSRNIRINNFKQRLEDFLTGLLLVIMLSQAKMRGYENANVGIFDVTKDERYALISKLTRKCQQTAVRLSNHNHQHNLVESVQKQDLFEKRRAQTGRKYFLPGAKIGLGRSGMSYFPFKGSWRKEKRHV